MAAAGEDSSSNLFVDLSHHIDPNEHWIVVLEKPEGTGRMSKIIATDTIPDRACGKALYEILAEREMINLDVMGVMAHLKNTHPEFEKMKTETYDACGFIIHTVEHAMRSREDDTDEDVTKMFNHLFGKHIPEEWAVCAYKVKGEEIMSSSFKPSTEKTTTDEDTLEDTEESTAKSTEETTES